MKKFLQKNYDKLFFKDFYESFTQPSLWIYLGWNDIKARYRRTILGPFWFILSTSLNMLALGAVGAIILKLDLYIIFPYIATGIIFWVFITSIIIESCVVFINAGSVIQNMYYPLLSLCIRLFVRNLIMLAHNIFLYIIIAIKFKIVLNSTVFLLFPAFLLVFITAISLSMLLGILCLRLRDFPQVISTILSMMLFVTPIMWKRDMLGTYSWLADYNPIASYLDILRAPLLGYAPQMFSYKMTVFISFALLIIGTITFKNFRSRIAYWV